MDTFSSSIGVIGAGAWGTALAVTMARHGRHVTLWGRNHQDLVDLAARHENSRYLPGLRLSSLPHVSRDLRDPMQADVVLLVVPAQELRGILPLLAVSARAAQSLVICAKGLERGTGRMLSEIVQEYFPASRPAVLSGPSFAREVAMGLPAALTLAAPDAEQAAQLSKLLSGPAFRCYASTDVAGVELCGAFKNVLAIACGIADGRRLGENARAALITRGLAELRRLVLAIGGQAETLLGLAGLGDVVLTCSSPQSRNFSLGRMLGEGRQLADIEAHPHKLSEGRLTASAVRGRAESLGIEVPVCQAVDDILNQGVAVDQTIAAMLARPLKSEHQ